MSFAAALAMADAAVSAMVDETVFVAISMGGTKDGQRRNVNAAPSPDPDRPDFTFRGAIDSDPSFNSISQSNRIAPGEMANRHVSTICITALITGWPWVPRQNDELRTPGAVYTIVAADRDGTDRIAFWVNRKA